MCFKATWTRCPTGSVLQSRPICTLKLKASNSDMIKDKLYSTKINPQPEEKGVACWKLCIHPRSGKNNFIEPYWPSLQSKAYWLLLLGGFLSYPWSQSKNSLSDRSPFCPLNCAITQFQNIKTLPSHPDSKMVYMSALKFLFSTFICMELVTVSCPTNHAMWAKQVIYCQAAFETTEIKLAGTFIISTGFKNKAIDRLCSLWLLSLCSFHMDKVTPVLKSCRVYRIILIQIYITHTGNMRLCGTLYSTLHVHVAYQESD